jgi:hypothetical protein
MKLFRRRESFDYAHIVNERRRKNEREEKREKRKAKRERLRVTMGNVRERWVVVTA